MSAFGSIGDEKNKAQLTRREDKFSKLFIIFKNTIDRDLELYKGKFVKDKLNYLKWYFKILFWDKSSQLDIRSEEFYQLTLASIPRYGIDMDDGRDPQHNESKPYYSSMTGRDKINGLQLAVEMGNLRPLVACSKIIQSFLNLRYVFKQKLPGTEIDNFPEKLLADASHKGFEDVMQCLFDQGVRPESDSKSRYSYNPALCRAISQNQYGSAMLLVAQEGDVNVLPPDGRKPLSQVYHRRLSMISLLILYAGKVSIDDDLHGTTLLTHVAKASWIYLEKLGSKDKSDTLIGDNIIRDLLEEIRLLSLGGESEKEKAKQVNHSMNILRGLNMVVSNADQLSEDKFNFLPHLLEAIRLLLILGADPKKVNDARAKQVINRIIPIVTYQESSPTGGIEGREDKRFSPPPRITYVKNFSFIREGKRRKQGELMPNANKNTIKLSLIPTATLDGSQSNLLQQMG